MVRLFFSCWHWSDSRNRRGEGWPDLDAAGDERAGKVHADDEEKMIGEHAEPAEEEGDEVLPPREPVQPSRDGDEDDCRREVPVEEEDERVDAGLPERVLGEHRSQSEERLHEAEGKHRPAPVPSLVVWVPLEWRAALAQGRQVPRRGGGRGRRRKLELVGPHLISRREAERNAQQS